MWWLYSGTCFLTYYGLCLPWELNNRQTTFPQRLTDRYTVAAFSAGWIRRINFIENYFSIWDSDRVIFFRHLYWQASHFLFIVYVKWSTCIYYSIKSLKALCSFSWYSLKGENRGGNHSENWKWLYDMFVHRKQRLVMELQLLNITMNIRRIHEKKGRHHQYFIWGTSTTGLKASWSMISWRNIRSMVSLFLVSDEKWGHQLVTNVLLVHLPTTANISVWVWVSWV